MANHDMSTSRMLESNAGAGFTVYVLSNPKDDAGIATSTPRVVGAYPSRADAHESGAVAASKDNAIGYFIANP